MQNSIPALKIQFYIMLIWVCYVCQVSDSRPPFLGKRGRTTLQQYKSVEEAGSTHYKKKRMTIIIVATYKQC